MSAVVANTAQVPTGGSQPTSSSDVSKPASFSTVTLDDKYALTQGRAFMNGTQALVRLPMMQRQRDLAAGLNTAGFISGYRGSPLCGYDQALWKAEKFLKKNHIFFTPGVNEELAATAVWGSQQVGLFEGAKYDGVFGIWYGKGPGVDRSGDVLSTRTPRVHRSTAVCCWLRQMTMRANRRHYRISRNIFLMPR